MGANFSANALHELRFFSFTDISDADDYPALALGLESKTIPDGRLSASSQWDKTHDVKQVRLNTVGGGAYGGAWSVRYVDADQWIQVCAGQFDYRFRIGSSKCI